ncbi:hypothetical protein FRC03_012889 [Tulasnella sp. 419]|nr:hypothetical protein FRC03_012889 [Tulasnella sp. 419]
MAPVYSHLYRTLQFEAPLLRKLVLRDFTHNWSWFRVPVQRVTHLELKLMRYKDPYLQRMMRVIEGMGSLKYLEIDITSPHPREPPIGSYSSSILLPHLETLKFTLSGSCWDLLTWVTHFDAPVLTLLDLTQQHHNPDGKHATAEWHLQQEGWRRQLFPSRVNFPFLEEIRAQTPPSHHCWQSYSIFASAIPSLSTLTIDYNLERPKREEWDVLCQFPHVNQLRIFSNNAHIQDIKFSSHTNPRMKLLYNDVVVFLPTN